MKKKLCSLCLLGVNCMWNGQNKRHDKLVAIAKRGEVVGVCPEQLGGFGTPRPAAEVINGDGLGVLEGKNKVINKFGEDESERFVRGAEEVWRLAQELGIDEFIGKAKSPSCGVGVTYDGTFSGKLVAGDGVCTALLRKKEIIVTSSEEY
ncbi:MAG: DUF523 domain-containing protein [Patescibacteria group bacterium]